MSKTESRDAVMLGGMLIVLLILFGFLVNEAVKGNWFTAIVLGIAVGPGIFGVSGLLLYVLRSRSGMSDSGNERPDSRSGG